jgi:hypothetical protein
VIAVASPWSHRGQKGPLIGRDGAKERRAIGFATEGFAKLTGDIRVGPQFVQGFLHTRAHSVRFVQGLFGLALKRAKIAFPVQAKTQGSIEHCRNVQPNRVGR